MTRLGFVLEVAIERRHMSNTLRQLARRQHPCFWQHLLNYLSRPDANPDSPCEKVLNDASIKSRQQKFQSQPC